jgi:hypothetical protein
MGGLLNNSRSEFMDEQPITPDNVVDTGAEDALPVETNDNGAALAAQEQKDSQPQGGEETPVPDAEDKLKSFAKGVGIEDITDLSERELKLLKVAKDNQAEFQRKAQESSELKKTVSGDAQQAIADAVNDGTVDDAQLALAQVAAMRLESSVDKFFNSNPDAKPYEAEMVRTITDRPEIGVLVRQGSLSVNDLYAMVRGGDQKIVQEAKTQGGKEALQQLANKQIAKAVPGSATTSSFSSTKKDAFSEGFDSV